MASEDVFEDCALVRELRRTSSTIELWPDKDNPDTSMRYVWIVDHNPPTTRIVAYLRSNGTLLQRRSYDHAGEEIWTAP